MWRGWAGSCCMQRTIVWVNQVTLHGIVVVGVARRCGTGHHSRHISVQSPAVAGRGLVLQSGRYRGLMERLCCPQRQRASSRRALQRVRYRLGLVFRRQGKLDLLACTAPRSGCIRPCGRLVLSYIFIISIRSRKFCSPRIPQRQNSAHHD